tara:strand:+ start:6482 stop:7201 length:720 start_codon:yes stop_codon:yes gene_type:complete
VIQGFSRNFGDEPRESPTNDAAGCFSNWTAHHKEERLAVLIIEFDRVSLVQAAVDRTTAARSDGLPKHLEEILPFGSYIERIGIDIFLVLLGDFETAQNISEMANKILGEIEDALPTPLNPRVGTSLYPDAGTDITVLTRRETIALTAAHDKSSSRVRMWSGARSSPTDNTYRFASDLGRALSHGEIELHYQPKVSATTGHVSGMEALVRWYHPRFGRIEPDEFVPLAEQNGLINQLGD